MQYFIFYIILFIGLLLWFIMKQKRSIQQVKERLKKEWGDLPNQEYTSEKFRTLQSYYRSVQDENLDVDDITWNDLSLDEIFVLMNNTGSAVGEEYLYALLRKPCYSKKELEERNNLIHLFQKEEDKRLQLQYALNDIGKLKNISVYEYMNRLDDLSPRSNLPHYLLGLGFLLSIVMLFVQPSLGGLLIILFLFINITYYYKRKAEIDAYLTVFAFIFRLYDGAKGIVKLEIPELQSYRTILEEKLHCFKKFRRGSRILTSKKATGNMMDLFFDYIRMIFHLDLIKFNSMLSFFRKNKDALNTMFETVGLLDSMIAVASFRTYLTYYCEPELCEGTSPYIEVTELFHPLIDHPVTNGIYEKRSVLITGSNASGKSTFIKTMAINAILSQTIYTSLSTKYRASYFMIYSSMALTDNLLNNESYYIVEIKSLKRIIDRTNKQIPMLCFVDEVLRGTNTIERIAASSRILNTLAQTNTLVFAATHDLELTHILEDHYSNYHFQEQIQNGEVLFDYLLYPGRAISKNAIKLLGMIGYPSEIIQEAEQAAEDFLVSGEWKRI